MMIWIQLLGQGELKTFISIYSMLTIVKLVEDLVEGE